VAALRVALSELKKTETRNTMTQLLNWLAEAQALNGATAEAMATIEEALNAKSGGTGVAARCAESARRIAPEDGSDRNGRS
jgi:hypothetical protein